MAIPCQGFTFTWGNLTLSEVQEMEIAAQSELPLGRTVIWTQAPGEVRLVGFSSTNLPYSDYGKRKVLKIEAPLPAPPPNQKLTLLNQDCILRDVNVRATANNAVRFAFTFMVMDTVNAPSNP